MNMYHIELIFLLNIFYLEVPMISFKATEKQIKVPTRSWLTHAKERKERDRTK